MSISPRAIDALKLVSDLQSRFVKGLEAVFCENGVAVGFVLTEWLRDGGAHGGGNRYTASDAIFFDRASVNVSQIHYEDLPEKKLASATAISTIIHPRNPHCPSVHIHISWTEMKGGTGYWRIMADLNPAVVHGEYRDEFVGILQQAAPSQYEAGAVQGGKYFFIPALDRHRGVTHFYLESYCSDDPAADRELAEIFGEAVIDGYLGILSKAAEKYSEIDEADREVQLAYHTLYLFQVLTLDRGTTSGLLAHDQNDLGIMGSLPSLVDRRLLAKLKGLVEGKQRDLVGALLGALPDGDVVEVGDEVKLRLAKAMRDFYKSNPAALELQASGGVISPTVENHR